MKMILKSVRFTAISIFLLSIVLKSYQELLVLRQLVFDDCISEDDDAALIWNYDLNKNIEQSPETIPEAKNVAKCAIRKSIGTKEDNCLAPWEWEGTWDQVTSDEKPMGPVFDYRWEYFQDITLKSESLWTRVSNTTRKNSGTLIFSVRAEGEVSVRLCPNESNEGSCFLIIIGEDGGSKSTIAVENLPSNDKGKSSITSVASSNKAASQIPEKFVDSYEWRTFRIKWIGKKRTIQIFEGTNDAPFLQGFIHQWHPVSNISMKSNKPARVRMHFYNYLSTKNPKSTISTSKFKHPGKNLCVELFVGICPRCKLLINVINQKGDNLEVGIIDGDEITAWDEMLSWNTAEPNEMLNWKSVKLNVSSNIINDQQSLKLEIRSILDKNENVGHWAIDNFRICKPAGSLRHIRPAGIEMQMKCQKLSYTENVVVNATSKNQIKRDKDRIRNFVEKWSLPEPHVRRFGFQFCDLNGCTCDRGFKSPHCKRCGPTEYGFDCKEQCGSCKNKPSSDTNCDRLNGHCIYGCRDEKLLKPFCRKEIGLPKIKNLTDTSAVIILQIESAKYANIQTVKFEISPFDKRYSPVSEAKLIDEMTYEAMITRGLTKHTTYSVHAIVKFKGQPKEKISSENYFVTSSVAHCYQVTVKPNSLLVKWNQDTEECPDYLKQYDKIVLKKASSKETVQDAGWPSNFQFQFVELDSKTKYKISVVNSESKPIFTTVVRTGESDEVRDLKYAFVNETQVTLEWNQPHKDNGIPMGYEVSIKLESFHGCENRNEPKREQNFIISNITNDRTISINGLHPYANYEATVFARYSVPGEPKKIIFSTNEKYIPTTAVNNLRIDDESNPTIIKWEKPEDCEEITGSIDWVVIIVTGIDDWAKDQIHRIETRLNSFRHDLNNPTSLTPYTTYNVRVHVIRNPEGAENLTNYRELNVTTLPSVPGAVRELAIYDADNEDTRHTISLRWMPPYPTHGEIESYEISIDDKNFKIYKKLDETRFETVDGSSEIKICELWKNYICLKNLKLPAEKSRDFYTVKVSAKNKNVEGRGKLIEQKIRDDDFTKNPASPQILTPTFLDHNRVKLEWNYPFSVTKITGFDVKVTTLTTNLREKKSSDFSPIVRTKEDQLFYEVILPLESSTNYSISLKSENRNKIKSNENVRRIEMPDNFVFKNDKQLVYEINDDNLKLHIPCVVNVTKDSSMIRVIVNGSFICTNNNETSSFSTNQIESTIDSYEIKNSDEPKELIVGLNQTILILGDSNCFLNVKQNYDIKVIVEYNEKKNFTVGKINVSLKTIDSSLLGLAALLLLPVGLLLLVYYRKNKRSRNNDNRKNDEIPCLTRTTRKSNFIALFKRSSSRSGRNSMGNRLSENIYADPNDPDSRAVTVDYFPKYVQMGADSGLLIAQYMSFPKNLIKSCEAARSPGNMYKNRTKNQLPYDHTRVVLRQICEDPCSDYINANYIQGYKNEKAYIATQIPLSNTLNEFWRMIWEEKVYVICLLTGEDEIEREKYWPEIGSKISYDNITVWNMNDQVFADYTIRYFKITCQKFKRNVTQLHFTAWPDNDIPLYTQPFVSYLTKLYEIRTGNWPIVVQCNNGDGRTGTTILCDICLKEAAARNVIDVLAVANKIYEGRANMIDNKEQYLFAHIVIIQSLMDEPTQVLCTQDFPIDIQNMREDLNSHITRLNDNEWQERALYALVMPQAPTPGDFSLKRLPELNAVYPDVAYFGRRSRGNSITSDHIVTVSVDGAKIKKQFLASQLPSHSTWSTYWRLIARNKVELVVMLQRPDPEDTSRRDIVPKDSSSFVPEVGINVQIKSRTRDKCYTTWKLSLTDTTGDEPREQPVTILRCTKWEQGENGRPPPASDLVALWSASERIRRNKGRILVLCHNGITGCGLYVALSFVLEKMTVDKECDVISAVRAVRRFRREFIESTEQFHYLYNAAIAYFTSFETYSNLF